MRLKRNGFSTLEALMALGILVAITLASVTISLQVIKTSKKSKIIALGIAIESALLEAISNNLNYPPNIVQGILPSPPGLLNGGLPDIPLKSNYNSPSTTVPIPFYTLSAANPPTALCFLDTGDFDAGCAGKWVLKLEASYRRTSNDLNDLPRFGVAYLISGRPDGPSFRSFGLKTLASATFQLSDFFFPIPQGVYSGDQKDYTVPVFGKCSAGEDAVISLFSIDLQSGQSGCVIKGNTCSVGEISSGLSASLSGPNVVLNFACKPIQKCGCKNIEPNNWQVTSFIPSSLVDQSAGSVCGKCEFAFKNSVPAKAYTNLSKMRFLENGVCPSRHYDATSWDCKATAVWTPMWSPGSTAYGNYLVKAAGCTAPVGPPSVPPAAPICWPDQWFCASYSPPPPEDKLPIKAQAAGVVSCKVEPDTAPLCGQYNYLIEPIGTAGNCQLQAAKAGKKDAKLQ